VALAANNKVLSYRICFVISRPKRNSHWRAPSTCGLHKNAW